MKGARVLSDKESEPVAIELRHPKLPPVQLEVRRAPRGQDLRLIGLGYDSEEETRSAGERWAFVLRRALAGSWIGADFGESGRKGGLAPWLAKEVASDHAASGHGELKVNPLTEGLFIYRGSVVAAYFGMFAEGQVAASLEGLRDWAAAVDDTPDEKLKTAFELYTAAAGVESEPSARLVLLTAAVEALATREPRAVPWPEAMNELQRVAAGLPFETADADRVRSALKDLRRESITQAGMRCVEGVDIGEFSDGTSSPEIFKRAYRLRSKLLHGTPVDRPEVSSIATKLHLLVGRLIAAWPSSDA